MIIAVPTDDGIYVSEHFGRCKYFLIAEVSDAVVRKELVENPHNKEEREGAGHGLVLKLLREKKVNLVFYTNIGGRMLDNLNSLHINAQVCDAGSKISDLINDQSPRNISE
ncbi:MAG: NifB/NifX family molybdenum-iron cluster-binding protein [Thermoplasmatales archaeon]